MITMWGGNKNIELKWWTFPGGERNVKIVNPEEIERFRSFTLTCAFRDSSDIIDLLLLVNAVRNVYRSASMRLAIPYFPFGRQDRVMTEGEPHALQVIAALINSCHFYEIETWDPHSDVIQAFFDPGVLKIKTQHELWAPFINSNSMIYPEIAIVSPDAGAAKKISKLASSITRPVSIIEASKVRDVKNGAILGSKVNGDDFNEINCAYIVDDICDGGRTFIELARTIRSTGYNGDLILCVTHGIFSKGLSCLEDFKGVYCVNNMSAENLTIFNNRHLNF